MGTWGTVASPSRRFSYRCETCSVLRTADCSSLTESYLSRCTFFCAVKARLVKVRSMFSPVGGCESRDLNTNIFKNIFCDCGTDIAFVQYIHSICWSLSPMPGLQEPDRHSLDRDRGVSVAFLLTGTWQ